MKILVLGATGFIGSRVVEYLLLEKKQPVRALVRDWRQAARIGRLPVELRKGSAEDAAAVRQAAEGCGAIVCCAHPFSSPAEGAVAARICQAAVQACAQASERRVVFFSSAMVYGLGCREVDEESDPRPDTPYGTTKWRCEKIFREAHRRGRIRAVILRPGIVYGPFSPSWTVRPARQMREGALILPRPAEGNCNALFVDDLARAAGEAAISGRADGLTLNLNGLAPLTWKEFYGFYEKAVRPGSLREIPPAALAGEWERRRRSEGSWAALARAMQDPAVRARISAVPLVSRLKKSLAFAGWKMPRPVGAERDEERGERVCHLPDPFLLRLYRQSPLVKGEKAVGVLGFAPRELAAGMQGTLDWLTWAGLSPGRTGGVAE